MTDHDIAVIGGGNAALCAAMTAAEAGARVLILETAPKPYRGGNSRHTRNFRCMHQGPLGPLVEDLFSEEEYLADLLKVTGGKTDEHLARLAIRTSRGMPALDAGPWRAVPTVAVRHPVAGAHQRLLHGRRQEPGECLLPHGARRWGSRCFTRPP